jgi:hypothetical protein
MVYISLPNGFLRYGVVLLALFPVYVTSATTASAQDVHEITDICMYSQRIVKDYALVGMGVHYHDPATDLTKNTKIIDKYITRLEKRDLEKQLTDEIGQLANLWKMARLQLLKKPNKTEMIELRQKVDKFSHRCAQIAEHLATDTGIKGEHYVVLVARLGMGVQRLAALYMMKAWDVVDADYYDDVQAILAEHEKNYNELIDADEKLVSPEIKKKLKSTEKHFMVFSFMAMSKSGRFVPTMAEKNASKIFHEIRDILKLEKELVE